MRRRTNDNVAPIFLEVLTRKGKDVMIEELDLEEATADRVMRRIVETICSELGGAQCYVPKVPPWALAKRDVMIAEKFDGTNSNELALEFNLSRRQLLFILESERLRRREVIAATASEPREPEMNTATSSMEAAAIRAEG